MTQEQMRNLNTIVETYGNDAQEDMAIEECSELVKAILKLRRSDEKTAETREAVIDEIVPLPKTAGTERFNRMKMRPAEVVLKSDLL